jgi:hypothetical protein
LSEDDADLVKHVAVLTTYKILIINIYIYIYIYGCVVYVLDNKLNKKHGTYIEIKKTDSPIQETFLDKTQT